jgi:hypothetical protein
VTPGTRRRLRTAALGVVACCALFWGAVDIIGVPPINLLRLLGQVIIGLVLLIALAAAPALIMIVVRGLRRRS